MLRNVFNKDIELVHILYTNPQTVDYLCHAPMPIEEFRQQFNRMSEKDYFWIYQNEAGVDCGMITADLLNERGQHTAKLGSMAILPDFRGKGHGKTLLIEVEQKLQAEGIQRIQLVTHIDNLVTISLYKKFGYKIEGKKIEKHAERSPGNFVDAIVMAKCALG